MSKPELKIIKVGGHVIDDASALDQFLSDFAALKGNKILIHGGGKLASLLGERLNLEVNMHEGRRITDAETLDVVTMVYAGLVNKKIVAQLQSKGLNALGLSGADANLICASKRPVSDIDYGFVGDLNPSSISISGFHEFLNQGLSPVCSAITHNGEGQLLNTNADTIASSIAIAMSELYNTSLIYCFEKQGVLTDVDNPDSLIREINTASFEVLKQQHIVAGGMLPKLENAFSAIHQGVKAVYIGNSTELNTLQQAQFGTKIIA